VGASSSVPRAAASASLTIGPSRCLRPHTRRRLRRRGITGGVAVFVVVDERGVVRGARACSGPRELRAAAEGAAFRARLKPTILSGKAVGNRGMLTYAFPPEGKGSDREPAPNNGMHPTRDTPPLIILRVVGGRVMPGVRLLGRCSPLLIERASEQVASGRGQSGAGHSGRPDLASGG
jgi:hypothetical protein